MIHSIKNKNYTVVTMSDESGTADTWATGRTFVTTALSFVAAFLWRDVINGMITSLRVFLERRNQSVVPHWIYTVFLQVGIALVFTFLAAYVINTIQSYTGPEKESRVQV